jgi:hypothetical protein
MIAMMLSATLSRQAFLVRKHAEHNSNDLLGWSILAISSRRRKGLKEKEVCLVYILIMSLELPCLRRRMMSLPLSCEDDSNGSKRGL